MIRTHAACLRRKGSALMFVYRALIGLLIFGLSFEPALLQAQTRRTRDGAGEKRERPKRRRSRIDAFSFPDTKQGGEQGLPSGVETGALRIGKAAYDAVIRSGRYIVGPGDMFEIVIEQGEEPEIQEAAVGAEGKLVIPYVGAIPLAGLSLSEANAAIEAAIRGRFRHLSIDVALSRLRTFPVDVLGEVRWPGSYRATGVEQVSELIVRAGGLLQPPEGRSSLRNIEVRRPSNGGEETSGRADLALWQFSGEAAHNPFLLDGDQIFVPVRGDSIGISGAVEHPGNYEYAPGDRIADLVRLGGGPVGDGGAATAELLRLSRDGQVEMRAEIDLAGAMAGEAAANIALRAGDKLRVEGEQERVTVEGEVRFPGAYPVGGGLTLRDLIERAGGFTQWASLGGASVIRMTDDGDEEGEIDVEADRLSRIPQADLTPEERAVLSMRTQQIQGRLPVDFVALFRGGGEGRNISLTGGDRVVIPRMASTVSVMGAVVTPGAIPYEATYTVKDYIARAGGFGARARSREVVVIKASTGNYVRASKVRRVDPGDTILVPSKVPGEGWQQFRETMLVLTQVATLIVLVRSLK